MPLLPRCVVTLFCASAAFAASLANGNGPRNVRPPSVDPLVSEWNAETLPTLPLDAIILEEEDEAVWADETLEFNGLRADPRTPAALRAHLRSFRLPNGKCCHAFDGAGQPIDNLSSELSDRNRTELIVQLLESVNFLHSRGSAHLGLDAAVVRAAAPTAERVAELRLVGLGAAVRLQAAPPTMGQERRSTYQLANAVSFHAPELLTASALVLKGNLRSLLRIDAWAVGVLVAIIAGSLDACPFEAEADWGKGVFSQEAATRATIEQTQRELGPFLMELDRCSGGFLFRNGWVIKLLLGLLENDPLERLTVVQALGIARDAVALQDGTAVTLDAVPVEAAAARGALLAEARAHDRGGSTPTPSPPRSVRTPSSTVTITRAA